MRAAVVSGCRMIAAFGRGGSLRAIGRDQGTGGNRQVAVGQVDVRRHADAETSAASGGVLIQAVTDPAFADDRHAEGAGQRGESRLGRAGRPGEHRVEHAAAGFAVDLAFDLFEEITAARVGRRDVGRCLFRVGLACAGRCGHPAAGGVPWLGFAPGGGNGRCCRPWPGRCFEQTDAQGQPGLGWRWPVISVTPAEPHQDVQQYGQDDAEPGCRFQKTTTRNVRSGLH